MRTRPLASTGMFVIPLLVVASVHADPKPESTTEATPTCFQDTCLNPDEPLGLAFGIEQFVDGNYTLETLETIHRTQDYIFETVLRHPEDPLPDDCWNHIPDCSFLSVVGRCDSNPDWMHMYCAPACQTCPNIYEYSDRCHPYFDSARDAVEGGELNQLLARIVQDHPNATAVSQPTATEDAPWILTVDGFLTDDECQAIIELAGDFRNSQEQFIIDSGEETNLDRFYCTEFDCDYSILFQTIRHKLHALTHFPLANMDHAQILRYQLHQQLALHHDWVNDDILYPQGPRVLTVNLYLNDVTEGGGTEFPQLKAIVEPKRGRLALWPNTLNSNPDQQDHRTVHRSIPVTKGTKYGVNVCLYLRDFRTPYEEGCAGNGDGSYA